MIHRMLEQQHALTFLIVEVFQLQKFEQWSLHKHIILITAPVAIYISMQ